MSTRDRLCSTIVSDLLAFPHLSFNDYLSQLLIAEKRRAALATQHARNLAFAQENRVTNVAIAKKNHVANVYLVLKLQLCVGPNVYVAGTSEIFFSRPYL